MKSVDNDDKVRRKRKTILLWLMILSIPFCFILPSIALSASPSWLSWLAFNKDTNEIAGSISGFTSPIFGFLSAILVYYSFHEQFEANQQQRRIVNTELKRNNLLKEYEQIVSLIDVYRTELETIENQIESGPAALTSYADMIDMHNPNPVYLEDFTPKIALSLGVFRTILDKIDTYGSFITNQDTELLDARKKDVEMLKVRMNIEFTKIEQPLSTLKHQENYNLQLSHFLRMVEDSNKLSRFNETGYSPVNTIRSGRIQNSLRIIFNESVTIYSKCRLMPEYKIPTANS